MSRWILSVAPAFLWLSSVASALVINVNQTFTNNVAPAQAATDLHWWYDPDCTVNAMWSDVFPTLGAQHFNQAGNYSGHAYATAVKLNYSGANVNSGAKAKVSAQLQNNGAQFITAFACEWTNGNFNPIGSANLPCSIGGEYEYAVEGHGNSLWLLHIDNPSPTMTAHIDQVSYALTHVNLAGSQLDTFTGPWNTWNYNVSIAPQTDYAITIETPDDTAYPVVDAYNLHWENSSDYSQLRFQVIPEPSALTLLGISAACLLLRRRTV